MSSLYIHIPFCKTKCHYCAFNSSAGKENLFQPYLEAITTELLQTAELHPRGQLQTIFFGGGTPTVLPASDLVQLVSLCDTLWGIEKGAEISTEANPETVDGEYLRTLRSGGFNRISFGVQSLLDDDLVILGRPHRAEKAIQVIREARKAGFDNLNFDLMSGLGGQTVSDWRKVLVKALELEPNHLSVYSLTPEPGTALYDNVVAEKTLLPSDEISLEMDALTVELCERSGLKQYETSNYAERGFECQHNINYWNNEEYLAIGAGAVSYIDGARDKRVEDAQSYIDMVRSGESLIVESDKLDKEASFRETVIISLRMNRGISLSALQQRFNLHPASYYGNTLKRLIDYELIEIVDGYLRLTPKGRPLTNMVLEELV